MTRKQSLRQEHKDALEKAMSMNISQAMTTGEYNGAICTVPENEEAATTANGSSSSGTVKWDELVGKLFSRNESAGLALKQEEDR